MSTVEGFKVERLETDTQFVITPKNPKGVMRLLSPKYLWLGAIILGVVLIAIIILFGAGAFSGTKVDLEIKAPEEIAAGEIVEFEVVMKNRNSVDLNDVELFFSYPSGAIPLVDDEIKEIINTTIEIGDLAAGEERSEIFRAIIVGDRGNIKVSQAILRFEPANLRSEFEVDSTFSTTITSLAIPIDLVSPPNVVSGQTVEYIIDYRNQSEEDFSDLRILVRYPDGFTRTKTSPTPDGTSTSIISEDSWDIDRLNQGEGDRIRIEGIITGQEREAKLITVILQRKTEIAGKEQYVDFEKAEATSIVSTPPLSIDLVVNNSKDTVGHLGETLIYTVTFGNNSDVDMTGILVSAKLRGSMFDLSTIRTNGFFDARSKTVVWDASAISSLGNLGANQTGIATFSVKLKDRFSGGIGVGTNDTLVGVEGAISTSNVPPDFNINRLFSENDIVTRISTDPTFNSTLHVVDPVWGSSGAHPPRVDTPSVYVVKWTLANPVTDISPAKIAVVLAPGVRWVGTTRTSGGLPQPGYLDRNRTVSWDLNTLKAGSGDVFPLAEAYFQVEIIPSVNLTGKTPDIMGPPVFSGTDVYTGEDFSKSLSLITTFNAVDGVNSEIVE